MAMAPRSWCKVRLRWFAGSFVTPRPVDGVCFNNRHGILLHDLFGSQALIWLRWRVSRCQTPAVILAPGRSLWQTPSTSRLTGSHGAAAPLRRWTLGASPTRPCAESRWNTAMRLFHLAQAFTCPTQGFCSSATHSFTTRRVPLGGQALVAMFAWPLRTRGLVGCLFINSGFFFCPLLRGRGVFFCIFRWFVSCSSEPFSPRTSSSTDGFLRTNLDLVNTAVDIAGVSVTSSEARNEGANFFTSVSGIISDFNVYAQNTLCTGLHFLFRVCVCVCVCDPPPPFLDLAWTSSDSVQHVASLLPPPW